MTEEKWITLARFHRVFAVYQILPGPVFICFFDRTQERSSNQLVSTYVIAYRICGHYFNILRRFISLGIYGLINMAITRHYFMPASILFVLQYVGYALYVVFKGFPSPVSLASEVDRVSC